MNVGDRVRKVGGSYEADGRIVALFAADDGSGRAVFRFDSPPGLLHIFRADQLVVLPGQGQKNLSDKQEDTDDR